MSNRVQRPADSRVGYVKCALLVILDVFIIIISVMVIKLYCTLLTSDGDDLFLVNEICNMASA